MSVVIMSWTITTWTIKSWTITSLTIWVEQFNTGLTIMSWTITSWTMTSWVSGVEQSLVEQSCQFRFQLVGFQIGRSVPFSARGVSDRLVQQSGIPYHSLTVTSCSTIHTFKKQLKTHSFSSAAPLVELSSMHLWFDDLHLFIYLVVLDFVRA